MTDHKFFVFSFADVEVREREFLLLKAGKAMPVEPKAFRVLLFLLRNPGKLVTKDEIFAAVWNDSFVSDNSLTRSIATLRRLLGDDAREPRYIATVQSVGYRFLCEVAATEEGTGVPAPLSITDQAAILQASDDPAITATPDVQARRGSRRLPVLIGVACLLLVLAGAVLALHVAGHRSKSGGHAGRMHMTPILSVSGKMSDPAFSPNSEEIAFVWDGENPVHGDVYVHLIGGEKPLRLTHTESGFTCCASWSPDGHQLAFGRCDDSGGAVFVVAALGGAERKVTNVACMYGNAGWPVWTADPHPVTFGPFEQQVPSWSRDGKSIYFTANNTGEWQVWKRELASGAEKQITHHGGYAAVESHDGKSLYYSKYEGGGIWTVQTAGGTEDKITGALHHGYWGHFAVVDSGIYFLDADAKPSPTILFYDFRSRHTAPVLTLTENPIPWTASLAASRNGLTLFFGQYKLTSSIALAEDSQ
jgi:DNA-binding winged helix-turn-helix (wHTH) protein